jgi:hypothetical protein
MEVTGLRHAPAALDKAKNTVDTDTGCYVGPGAGVDVTGKGKNSLTATGIRNRDYSLCSLVTIPTTLAGPQHHDVG